MDKLEDSIKKLGFGLMRLPRNGKEIDIEQTKQMVDEFIKAGFTYFDTAWIYEGSEDAAKAALVDRYPRESFQLATKNAAWNNCKCREDAIAQFETSLQRTGAKYFDFYLLHNLGGERSEIFEKFHLWEFFLEKKKEGLIKHLGFSCHTTPEDLDSILTKHPEAEFVQLQINYADWDNPDVQAGRCYEMARKHKKPIIVMEPVKGGMLTKPHPAVAEIFKKANPNVSLASWCIRFAASLDGVITVLSGMSDLQQMRDNLSFMKDFQPLSPEEQNVIGDACDAINGLPLIQCTSCNYCAKVCPQNIGISGAFTAMNYLTIYGDNEATRGQYYWHVTAPGKKDPVDCVQCGKCEKVCPQHIKIRMHLQDVAEAFQQTKK